MSRLIDAEALKKTFCAECDHTISCEDCDIDFHFEHLAPTVEAAPIKWLEDQAKDTPYQHRVDGLIERWRREHE